MTKEYKEFKEYEEYKERGTVKSEGDRPALSKLKARRNG